MWYPVIDYCTQGTFSGSLQCKSNVIKENEKVGYKCSTPFSRQNDNSCSFKVEQTAELCYMVKNLSVQRKKLSALDNLLTIVLFEENIHC